MPDLSDDPRYDRRVLRGAARRRKVRTRLWLVTAPAFVVIAAVVTVLVVFGGQRGGEGVTALSTTTLLPGPVSEGTLLIVEQGEDFPLIVLLQRRSSGGVVLAIPGVTLLKAGDRFQTVSSIAASGEPDLLVGALSAAFGARADSVAAVAWPGLREVLIEVGAEGLPSETLTSDEGDAAQVARALLALLDGTRGADLRERVTLSGESSLFRASVAAFAEDGGEWLPATVSGVVVQSRTATYLNPKSDVVRALLADTAHEAPISVEVQNGSGVIGVAEQAMTQLAPLGYEVSVAGNSKDFPDVEQTRIEVYPGETETGGLVRAMLGTGAVTENMEVESGHVVVVLGKDYGLVPTSSGDMAAVGVSRPAAGRG